LKNSVNETYLYKGNVELIKCGATPIDETWDGGVINHKATQEDLLEQFSLFDNVNNLTSIRHCGLDPQSHTESAIQGFRVEPGMTQAGRDCLTC